MAALPRPASQRRVLVDSSAFLALRDADDAHHQEASLILAQLAQTRYRLYTTNAMLIEAHALILSVLGTQQANQFLRDIDHGSTIVVRVRQQDEEQARQILFRYTDKEFSYNDAISFVVMERLGISSAFTFDHDFARYGLTVLHVQQP
jgi:uncharacterized protein